MDNIGHFPMTENPELFMTYLSPILDSIAAATTS
jgi:pimeloyl-ACP methyl ester carboxylesterase